MRKRLLELVQIEILYRQAGNMCGSKCLHNDQELPLKALALEKEFDGLENPW